MTMTSGVAENINDTSGVESVGEAVSDTAGVVGNTQSELNQDFQHEAMTDKQRVMIEQLQKAKDVNEQTELFKKWMDENHLDGILGLLFVAGDLGVAAVSTLFFLVQAAKMKLRRRDRFKIVGYQAADGIVGCVPLLGDILDFVGMKSNKRSADLFTKTYARMLEEAEKEGVDTAELTQLRIEGEDFAREMKRTAPNQWNHHVDIAA